MNSPFSPDFLPIVDNYENIFFYWSSSQLSATQRLKRSKVKSAVCCVFLVFLSVLRNPSFLSKQKELLPGRKVKISGFGWDRIKSFLKMSEWIKTAAFVAFPFIGAVPGSLITRKSMDWYDVSWNLRHEKWFINRKKISYF